jgi:hypothetical protein
LIPAISASDAVVTLYQQKGVEVEAGQGASPARYA